MGVKSKVGAYPLGDIRPFLAGKQVRHPGFCCMQQKIPAAFATAGTVPPDLLPSWGMAGPEHSLDEERPLSSTRQVSWLPAHRLSRAFPSDKDSGISGRLTSYSGASAADSHRFPCSRPFIRRAGLIGL